MSANAVITHGVLAHGACTHRAQHAARPQRLAPVAALKGGYLTGAPLPATCRLAAAVQRPRRVRTDLQSRLPATGNTAGHCVGPG